jgi:hypothetical protein
MKLMLQTHALTCFWLESMGGQARTPIGTSGKFLFRILTFAFVWQENMGCDQHTWSAEILVYRGETLGKMLVFFKVISNC